MTWQSPASFTMGVSCGHCRKAWAIEVFAVTGEEIPYEAAVRPEQDA